MNRVNFPMTIDDLIADAQEVKKRFGGDKYVLISNDVEGNGYHECYFTFCDATELYGTSCGFPFDLELEDCVTLG